MGFLGSIFGKKKVESASRPAQKMLSAELQVSELPAWLQSKFGQDMEKEGRRFAELSKGLLESVDDFQKNIHSIRNKGFEEGDRTYAAINMIKDMWSKRALMSISSYQREINSGAITSGTMKFSDFKNLFHSTMKLLNETNMIPKQKIVLQRYFEKESRRMADILKSMGEKIEEMRLATDERSSLKALDGVEKMMGDMSTMEGEIPSFEARLNELEKDKERKEKEMTDADSALKYVEKSPEWDNLRDLNDGLEKSEKAIEEVESKVMGKLGDFKRVMKLFAHDSQSLQKTERKLAESLSHSPMKAYISNDVSQIQDIFKKLVLSVETGAYAIPGKESGKIGDIKEIVDSGWLGVVRAEHDEAKENAADYKEKIGKIKVNLQKGEAQRAAEKARVETKNISIEKADLEGKIKERRGSLDSKKKEISDYVKKEFGAEVRLS
jgi:hypothetical protein